jgi:hypothetical protein
MKKEKCKICGKEPSLNPRKWWEIWKPKFICFPAGYYMQIYIEGKYI